MPAPRDTAVIVAAARLYYEQGRSQNAVADELGLSRSNVSRILAQARDRGIVEIFINDPDGPPRRRTDLEGELIAAFPLTGAQVLSVPRASGMESVARAGATLLSERIPEVSRIGVSWGQTVQRVVAHLSPLHLRSAPRVLPLVGGLSSLDQLEAGESVLRVLASRVGARAATLYAPAVVESAAAGRALRQESSIVSVLAEAATVELALVGIGSTGVHSSRHLVELMRLDPAERESFEAQAPVGDVCGRFVDADGNPLGPPSQDRVLAVSFPDLLGIPEVVGVAAGADKAPGVAGVLRSGAVHTAVLDADLAREVLRRA